VFGEAAGGGRQAHVCVRPPHVQLSGGRRGHVPGGGGRGGRAPDPVRVSGAREGGFQPPVGRGRGRRVRAPAAGAHGVRGRAPGRGRQGVEDPGASGGGEGGHAGEHREGAGPDREDRPAGGQGRRAREPRPPVREAGRPDPPLQLLRQPQDQAPRARPPHHRRLRHLPLHLPRLRVPRPRPPRHALRRNPTSRKVIQQSTSIAEGLARPSLTLVQVHSVKCAGRVLHLISAVNVRQTCPLAPALPRILAEIFSPGCWYGLSVFSL
jgi:hypothetical protein